MGEALPDLIARFQIKRGLFRKEIVDALLFSLDQFSCTMKTDKVFELGHTLQLDLIVEMPFDNIHLNGINALITERTKHCSNFFYSIDFLLDLSTQKLADSEQLRRIQDVVSKKQSLRSRRVSGRAASFGQTV